MRIVIKMVVCLFLIACTHQSAFAASKFGKPQTADFSNEDVIDGFNKTVFGSEYSNRNKNFKIHVKKFRKPIRLYVNNFIGTKYKKIEERIKNFVVYIPYANIKIVKKKSKANAFIHLFPNDDKKVRNYLGALSIKGRLSKQGRRNVENFQCALKLRIDKRYNIYRTHAFVFADQYWPYYLPCLTEEFMQSLGPVNDDESLKYSIFADGPAYSRLQLFDVYILNMLYHPKIRAGMRKKDVQPILPAILEEVKATLRPLLEN